MKIALFEPHPFYGGGSEQVVLDVSRHLAGRGHEFYLLHEGEGSMLRAYDGFVRERRQMELRPFGWRTIGATILRARRVAQCWKSWGVDLVFSSDLHYLRFLAMVGRLARLPVVLHLGIPNSLAFRSQRMALKSFAAGIAPSAHTAEAWRSDGWPANRLHVIPNGVDTTRFRPTNDRRALRKKLGLPADCPMIVYVGRLTQEKGVATLLKAFKQVRMAYPQAMLVVVGGNKNGSADPWPEEARLVGLPEEAVLFTGRQSNPEDYLAAADLATVPSEWNEPFGLTVIEAMACGTPPIVSDRGILPRLVGPARPKLVFPAGQADALADAITWWLQNDNQRRELAVEFALIAKTIHGSERMAEAYEPIFLQSTKSG